MRHALSRLGAAIAAHFDPDRSSGRVYVFILLGPGALVLVRHLSAPLPPAWFGVLAYAMGGLVAWAMRMARDTDYGPKESRVITLFPGEREDSHHLVAALLYRHTNGTERGVEIDGRDFNAVLRWSVQATPTQGPWGRGMRIRLRRPAPVPGPADGPTGPRTDRQG